MQKVFLPLGLLVGSVAFGAQPVASVSSEGTFSLRGVTVDSVGVSRWPVVSGDTIAAESAPSIIQFRDGSRVLLTKGSKATVTAEGGSISLRLLAGNMQVDQVAGSKVAISSVGQSATSTVTKALHASPGPFTINPVCLSSR